MDEDANYLTLTVKLAAESLSLGGFPVGAILVSSSGNIFTGTSATCSAVDVTSHAEISAIRAAKDDLGGTLYSSLEPCLMCLAAAAGWAKVRRIVFACPRSLVNSLHYETDLTAGEGARLFRTAPDIVHVAGFEEEVVSLIQEYERLKFTTH